MLNKIVSVGPTSDESLLDQVKAVLAEGPSWRSEDDYRADVQWFRSLARIDDLVQEIVRQSSSESKAEWNAFFKECYVVSHFNSVDTPEKLFHLLELTRRVGVDRRYSPDWLLHDFQCLVRNWLNPNRFESLSHYLFFLVTLQEKTLKLGFWMGGLLDIEKMARDVRDEIKREEGAAAREQDRTQFKRRCQTPFILTIDHELRQAWLLWAPVEKIYSDLTVLKADINEIGRASAHEYPDLKNARFFNFDLPSGFSTRVYCVKSGTIRRFYLVITENKTGLSGVLPIPAFCPNGNGHNQENYLALIQNRCKCLDLSVFTEAFGNLLQLPEETKVLAAEIVSAAVPIASKSSGVSGAPQAWSEAEIKRAFEEDALNRVFQEVFTAPRNYRNGAEVVGCLLKAEVLEQYPVLRNALYLMFDVDGKPIKQLLKEKIKPCSVLEFKGFRMLVLCLAAGEWEKSKAYQKFLSEFLPRRRDLLCRLTSVYVSGKPVFVENPGVPTEDPCRIVFNPALTHASPDQFAFQISLIFDLIRDHREQTKDPKGIRLSALAECESYLQALLKDEAFRRVGMLVESQCTRVKLAIEMPGLDLNQTSDGQLEIVETRQTKIEAVDKAKAGRLKAEYDRGNLEICEYLKSEGLGDRIQEVVRKIRLAAQGYFAVKSLVLQKEVAVQEILPILELIPRSALVKLITPTSALRIVEYFILFHDQDSFFEQVVKKLNDEESASFTVALLRMYSPDSLVASARYFKALSLIKLHSRTVEAAKELPSIPDCKLGKVLQDISRRLESEKLSDAKVDSICRILISSPREFYVYSDWDESYDFRCLALAIVAYFNRQFDGAALNFILEYLATTDEIANDVSLGISLEGLREQVYNQESKYFSEAYQFLCMKCFKGLVVEPDYLETARTTEEWKLAIPYLFLDSEGRSLAVFVNNMALSEQGISFFHALIEVSCLPDVSWAYPAVEALAILEFDLCDQFGISSTVLLRLMLDNAQFVKILIELASKLAGKFKGRLSTLLDRLIQDADENDTFFKINLIRNYDIFIAPENNSFISKHALDLYFHADDSELTDEDCVALLECIDRLCGGLSCLATTKGLSVPGLIKLKRVEGANRGRISPLAGAILALIAHYDWDKTDAEGFGDVVETLAIQANKGHRWSQQVLGVFLDSSFLQGYVQEMPEFLIFVTRVLIGEEIPALIPPYPMKLLAKYLGSPDNVVVLLRSLSDSPISFFADFLAYFDRPFDPGSELDDLLRVAVTILNVGVDCFDHPEFPKQYLNKKYFSRLWFKILDILLAHDQKAIKILFPILDELFERPVATSLAGEVLESGDWVVSPLDGVLQLKETDDNREAIQKFQRVLATLVLKS